MAEPIVNPGRKDAGPSQQPPVMDKPVNPPRAQQHVMPGGSSMGGSPTDERPPTARKG